jgi:hypothetical protein
MLSNLIGPTRAIKDQAQGPAGYLKTLRICSLAVRGWPFYSIAILALLNGVLIFELLETRSENQVWKSKIVLSLGEQMAVIEHGLEGRELQNEITRLQSLKVHANELFGHAGGRVLLLLFRGSACDRCLNMEMTLFKKHRDLLERMGINIIIVFSDIDEYQYKSFSNLFDITDIAVRDEVTGFAGFHNIASPIMLLLSPDRYVIAANISDYRDEGKSARFYEKVFHLIQGN